MNEIFQVSSYHFLFPLQVAAYDALMKYESEVKGRARYGVRAFADALLVIPKTLGKLIDLGCVQYGG